MTATGSRLAFLDQDGYLVATNNWMKTGWVPSHSGGPVNLIDNGQVTGSAPGFVDLAADDFELVESSPCIDAAAALHPAVLPGHRPVFEYVRHQMSRARADDRQLDIGAYEFVSAVGVDAAARAEPLSGIRVLRNPFAGECEIRAIDSRLASGADAIVGTAIDVLDVSGRLVARCQPIEPGRWVWRPNVHTAPGLYVLRSGRHTARATLVR